MRAYWRALLFAVGLTLALTVALWPRPTYASCDVNIGCYLDEGIVTLLRFLAQIGWFLNGSLLLLSRWIEEQRNWLISDVMASLFSSLLRGASVAWAQAVVIAVVLFVIGFSLRAIAELNWVDARRAIRNGVIALVVFTYGAQLMAASETARVSLSMAASQVAVDSLSTAGAAHMLTGGSSRPGDQMPPVATIYPGAACAGIVPARTSSVPQTVFINDIAANYLFATAEDVHCPSEAGASQNTPALPRVFWEGGVYPTNTMGPPEGGSAVQFEGYYRRTPGEAFDDTDRQRIVALAMDGAVRQLFGLFLTIPAVIEQVIQLVFALGLAALWLSLTISLVFALFVPTEGMVSSIGRAGMEIVKASVMTTIGVTLVSFVTRTVAGSSGVNAGLVAFVGLLCLIVLVVILLNTVRVVFNLAAGMAGITLGAAPQAVLGALGGMGVMAAMALKAAPEALSAGQNAGAAAEERARAGGASDGEAKAAGHRAAITTRNAALRTSAMRTFTDIGRATTDAAGFFHDPLRQSMRWQDRADAERRQQEMIAAMGGRDEQSAIGQVAAQPGAGTGISAGASGRPPSTTTQSSTASRLRGLPPASSSNPYTSQTTALGSPVERQAAEEVSTAGKELERAKAELDRVQQQLAAAQGRAAVQRPSALNEREIRRLEQEAEGSTGQVARLRQQLDEAERVQRQVRGDAEAQRAWKVVQATENQRDAATGSTPQVVIRASIGMAQQQLDREQQQLNQRPSGDPTAADDRAWIQQQQAAIGSLRQWNEMLLRPDTSAADKAAGEAAIRKIHEDAERERSVAQQAGNTQREQIASGVASLARAMLPAASAGAASLVGVASSDLAPGVAQAPTGAATEAATAAGVAPPTTAAGTAQAPTGAATGAATAAGVAAPPTPTAGTAQAPTGAATGAAAASVAAPPAPTADTAQAPAGAATEGSSTGAGTAARAGSPVPTSGPAAAPPLPNANGGAPAATTTPVAPGIAGSVPHQPTLAQRLQAQPTPAQVLADGPVAVAPTPTAAPPAPMPAPKSVAAAPAALGESTRSGNSDHAQLPTGGCISPTPAPSGAASPPPGVAPAPAVSGTPASTARAAAPHTNTTPGTSSAPGIRSTIPAPSPATSDAQAPAGAGAPLAADGQATRRRLRVGGVERRER